ncbi:hypothetical protein CWATWH8502_2427 [Crocosphaera watsonii WH 8502]|uniref:Uncharacterized protein n=4 Tax=Crocosphaera watsonii TaxID=263511 RepID=G5JBH3_CROWT|nr:hypothetical protein CWATWH0003_4789 [Crocosphaera watsonii WH 0003]CCQ51157.1 hypothetical protein CWATWH8502_2427 [Crocosphaera watsonii WH 8502]CCQ59537.1 hypothetical protein CWATWH0005_1570 [Crocosphaera watsonii WH 0005]CCQ63451.1 hypothetical protein CWATWH0401_791 [Crocosphaera watsonii WH 0401]
MSVTNAQKWYFVKIKNQEDKKDTFCYKRTQKVPKQFNLEAD